MMPPFALVAAAWSTAFLTWLARWGYAGVALGVFLESVGVPVPGETALFAAAFGAACGALALPWMIGTAAIASVLGDNLGFALGRRLGRGWLEHHGRRVLFTPERLAQVDRFFARHGPVAVALAVTLSYVLARQGLTGWWTLAVVVLFSALVGVSRIYLDVHWATDVIGGWVVGLAVASGGAALAWSAAVTHTSAAALLAHVRDQANAPPLTVAPPGGVVIPATEAP